MAHSLSMITSSLRDPEPMAAAIGVRGPRADRLSLETPYEPEPGVVDATVALLR